MAAPPVTLGRGKLALGAYTGADLGTPPDYVTGFSYVGNVTEFQVQPDEDELEHKDYQGPGLRVVDEIATLELKGSGTFTMDHTTADNIALYLRATASNGVVIMFNNYQGRYAMRFEQRNAIGENRVWTVRKVKLKPAGNFGLIGDDWQKMQMNFRILQDKDNYTEQEGQWCRIDPTSTTTTTTTSTTTTSTTTTTTTTT